MCFENVAGLKRKENNYWVKMETWFQGVMENGRRRANLFQMMKRIEDEGRQTISEGGL